MSSWPWNNNNRRVLMEMWSSLVALWWSVFIVASLTNSLCSFLPKVSDTSNFLWDATHRLFGTYDILNLDILNYDYTFTLGIRGHHKLLCSASEHYLNVRFCSVRNYLSKSCCVKCTVWQNDATCFTIPVPRYLPPAAAVCFLVLLTKPQENRV